MKLKLRIFALMAMLLCFAFQANAQDQGEITTETGLGNALSYGGEYHLGNDVTTTEAITTSGVTSVIDLNGYTLTIGAGDNKFCDASNITIKNGTISITGLTVGGNAVFCLDEYEETLVTTLTLEHVNLVGEDYSSAYCIFYIGRSSVLNVKGGEWSLENDKSTSGGVFKAEDSAATLNIDGLNLTAHNVRRVVLYAATTIENSTLAISGDADGVDAEMEHGFNRSPLAISNSTITMTDMVGRGITAENGAVTIENSTVTMTNCQEATIDVRGGQTVTIDDASTVELDKEPTIASGTISGDVVLPVYVAQIGETKYTTLAEAVSAAGEMSGDVTVEVYDKVTLNTAFSGSYSSINFVGKDTDAEIYLDVQGYITATGKKVSFKDLTLSKSQGGHITNAAFMNVAFGVYDVVEVAYTNCVFANGAYASSGNVTYTNCTFKKSWDKYGLWAYGDVDVTVDGCKFDDYRGIKMYAEGKAKTTELTVKNTDFRALGGEGSKPAIVLTYGASVVLENNTYSGTGTLELDLDGDPNGTAVTSDVAPVCVNDNGACGVLVDGEIYTTVAQAAEVATAGSNVTLLYSTTDAVEFAEGVNLTLANGVTADNVTVKVAGLKGEGTAEDPYLIETLDDLKFFRDDVNTYTQDGSNQYKGKYVKLTADIDLEGENWEPIGKNPNGDHQNFLGTFYGEKADGTKPTISNLYINANSGHLGFFARVGSYDEGVAPTIKNIKFNNVDVSSNDHAGSYVGGVIANAGGNSVVSGIEVTGRVRVEGYGYIGGIVGHGYPDIDNCHVAANDDSYIHSYYWCAGGIIGYAGEGGTPITNSSVSGVDIWSAYGAAAAIAGLLLEGNKLENVSASNVEITSNSDYYMGYIAGNGKASTMTGITVENVTAAANGNPITSTDAVAQVNDAIFFSLQEAIKAAAPAGTVELLADVVVDEWVMFSETLSISNGDIITTQINGLTINGNGKTVTVKDVESAGNGGRLFYDATNLNINNLTFNFVDNAASLGGIGLTAGTIENVTFNGGGYAIFPGTGEVTIEGCTFKTNATSIYYEDERDNLVVTGNTFENPDNVNVILLRGNTTFTNNTVKSGRTVNVVSGSPVVTGNDFNDVRFKVYNVATATIENNTINTLAFNDESVVNSTFDSNTLSAEAQAVLDAANFPVPVAKVGDVEYTSLQAALNAAAAGTGNVTVTILEDVNLTGVTWTPVTVSGPGYPVVTVEGNDKTITGLTDMLFAGTWAGNSGLIIKNLTIANSTIVNDKDDAKGNVGVGAFIGFPQASATITLENCHLKDSRVEGGHWTGGLIGYAAGYAGPDGPVFMNLTIKGCSVTGSTITGKGSAGGVIGHGSGNGWTNVVIEETTVSRNTITSTGSSTNKAGAVMGTIGAAGQPTTANGVTKTGGASVSATVADNTVTSNGTVITTIYGRQGTGTGMLYVAGGSYDNYPIEQGVSYAAPIEGYEIVENADGTYGIQEAEVVVAKIGEVEYESLQAAVDAATTGQTIILLADVELTETLTIPEDKTIALDLNGKTISQTKEQTAGYQMILNDGNLTIDDSSESKAGKISYTDSGNGGEYISDVIYNRSVLVINGGTIENLSSATVASNGYPHAVDTYSGIRDTYVEINGGTIYCAEYSAIRMFCVSATNKADLVINGGTIKGAIDMQNGTKLAALGTLTINDGTFETTKNANNIRFANWNGGATEYGVSAEIKGGSFNGGITTQYVPAAANWNKGIISGGTYAQDMTEYCAEGFICEANGDGTYGVVNDPGYAPVWTFDDSNSVDYTNGTELTVGTLTFKRTFIAGIWNPLYLPFDIELTAELLDKFEFYEYNQMLSTDTDGDRVPDDFAMELFVFQGGTLEANYPYFVRPKNAEVCTMEVVMNDAKLYEADENSFETASMKNIFTLSGTHKSMTADELAGKFVMSTEGKWQPAGSNMKSHRLYLSITDRNGNSIASKAIRMVVRGEDGFEGTTGVDIVETDNAADGTIYDLSGRPVVEPVKGGMYIINGKKVVY